MAKVYCSAVVPAAVEDVWTTIRDFNGMPSWHPMVRDSEIEDGARGDAVGAVRSFHFTDGRHLRERLLALTDLDHGYVSTIIESELPVVHYLAELRLRRVTADEHTFAEWLAQFDVADADEAEVCDTVTTMFHEGLAALIDRFSR
jgi:hypothetical protein